MCIPGYYSIMALPIIQCHDIDFQHAPAPPSTEAGCYPCPLPATGGCLNCTADTITVNAGYRLLVDDGEISQPRHIFKCPVASACPAQELESAAPSNASGTLSLSAQPCAPGHTGTLCFQCLDGWKKGPLGDCSLCSTSNGGMLSALFVMLIAAVIVYIFFRKLLTFKRQQRLKKLGASRAMFRDMDTDSSGRITREEMRNSLAVLGLEVSSETAISIVETIDVDHSGDIDEHEFVAWMEYNVSRFKMALVVGKIMLGLVQVLSKQPTVLKESFPGPQWESVFMKFWAFDFGWVMPVCKVNYYEKFVLNAVVLPVFLMGLVKLTWALNTRATKKEKAVENQNKTPGVEEDNDTLEETRQQAEIRRLFEEVDADGTGELDRAEVNKLAERLGERLSEGDLEAAMIAMDGNGDGHVEFEEFARWYNRMLGKDDDSYDEAKASRRSDYYFAFFLCCE